MSNKDPTFVSRRNFEGYLDLTAYEAERNIIMETLENNIETAETVEKTADDNTKKKYSKDTVRFFETLDLIFKICRLAGFHVEGRISLKDIKTGRIWK